MLKVSCPTCKKATEWQTNNPYRPFCCERCKLIDLGEWAAERHVISGQSLTQPPSGFDEFDLDDNFPIDDNFFKN